MQEVWCRLFLFNLTCSDVPVLSFIGEMEVDILEFVVPVENNKTLFVWDIQPSLTEAQIYVSPPGLGIRPQSCLVQTGLWMYLNVSGT